MEERLGLLEVADGLIKTSQIVQTGGYARVLRPEGLLCDLKFTLKDGLGAFVVTRCKVEPA